MKSGALIHVFIGLVIATFCLIVAGCGEHAEPIEGPISMAADEQ